MRLRFQTGLRCTRLDGDGSSRCAVVDCGRSRQRAMGVYSALMQHFFVVEDPPGCEVVFWVVAIDDAGNVHPICSGRPFDPDDVPI